MNILIRLLGCTVLAGPVAAAAQAGKVVGLTASGQGWSESAFQFAAAALPPSAPAAWIAVPLPVGYRAIALAADGSVLLDAPDPLLPWMRRCRLWRAGSLQPFGPVSPRTGWNLLPLMNRNGDIAASWLDADGAEHLSLISRTGQWIDPSPLQVGAARWQALSNTTVAGTDGVEAGRNFNPDRQDYDPFFYMAGVLWNLGGGRTQVGPRGAMGHNAPWVPYRVNDRGDYLAEIWTEIDGSLYFETDSYNGTPLTFAATALDESGTVAGWDFDSDRPCRWSAGVLREICDRPGIPVALSANGTILINHTDGSVALWQSVPGNEAYHAVELAPLLSAALAPRAVALGSDGTVLLNARSASGEDSPWLLVPAALRTDVDRNGRIAPGEADLATRSAPFRFWVNDDDDDGDEKRSAKDDVPLPAEHRRRNAANSAVDGIRDLEDFFPVHLDVGPLLALAPPETPGVRYRLRQADGALGVVFTALTPDNALAYLRGDARARSPVFGPSLSTRIDDAPVHPISADGLELFSAATGSPAFLAQLRAGSGGILLVEASQSTSSPLVLEVTSGAEVIARLALELEITDARAMIRFHNLRAAAHGTPIKPANQGPRFAENGPGEAPADPFAAQPNRTNFVWVHGYNVNAGAAVGTALTVFKRLYWAGSNARFHAVLWRGDDGQLTAFGRNFGTPDYHRNVGHAWQQGMLLRDFLLSLPEPTSIAAHSLRNVVTMVALAYERDPADPTRFRKAGKPPGVAAYYAIDAALPLEALDTADLTVESTAKMRHKDWREYDSQPRLWPTHWHRLFSGTGDQRENLTWQNVFSHLELGVNLYSSGEEVLANPEDDGTPFWDPILRGGKRAWVTQEKHKGGAGPAAPLLRSRSGGWKINPYWDVANRDSSVPFRPRRGSELADTSPPDGIPTAALVANPFFAPFQPTENGLFYPGYNGANLHREIGDPVGSAEASKIVTVAKLLGESIPALSYATGSNPSRSLGRMGGNFDLNSSDFIQGRPRKRSSGAWLHSDCVDLPLMYHYNLYRLLTGDSSFL